jgi:conjugative transfer region lipoprotein (TIGR03751 family)
METTIPLTVLLISTVLISGCSTPKKQSSAGSKPKVTTASLMKSVSPNETDKAFRKQSGGWDTLPNHSSYTRTEQNELNGLFPRLPNPDILMYVYPHLSSEGATVPGYTSSFSMYEKNEYALPGEAMSIWQRR